MKKLLIFLPFILIASTYPDFRPCFQKYSYIKNQIPITKTKSVTFDKKNCLNYDPFTGICVISHKNKKIVKFFDKPKLGWWASSIRHNEIYVGNFAKDEIFFIPAILSVKSPKNSVITDMFCRAIGVGNGDGFIKGDMVKHFVKYGYWGDIGIEVDENMKIVSFDPFYVKNLKIGDKIIKINSIPANPKIFKEYILKGICNKSVVLNVNGKKIKVKIRKKAYLFTPLEHFGIKVDKNLKVISIPKNLKKTYFIKPGAKIVKVNGKEIKTFEQLKKTLSTYKNVTISLIQQGISATIPLR
jgi:membrane-associated protease RseP (regulator of RpoE activity)